MAIPGGPANKLGNLYESWWTVSQLMRVVHGEAVSIEIERPETNFAEFVVKAGDAEEYHQAKRSHPTGKWTLTSLESEVLRPAIHALAATPNARLVFVSRSDAPELRELSERARNASDCRDFESRFAAAEVWKTAFERIVRITPGRAPVGAFSALRRITVRTMDEDALRTHVEDRLRLSLAGEHGVAEERLRALVADSVHATLDRAKVLAHLGEAGIRKREPPTDPISLIDAATDRYLQTAKRRLIQNNFIPTPATAKLLERIRTASNGLSIRLTGTAGSGKTASLYECIRLLRIGSKPIPVLAFRLDRLSATDSATRLGKALGLEESPALVLGAAAKATLGPAVLVIDQLDAVSTASGRRSEFFDAVEELLSEVRALRQSLTVHVILACRKFDWDNDHRLRRLVPRESSSVTATEFADDQLKTALEAAGFAGSDFSDLQLTLLRLPLHLALFLNAVQPPNTPTFSSTTDLLALYWSAKREAVNLRAQPSPDYWHDVVTRTCAAMSDKQELSIPREYLDPLPSDYLKELFSEGVLVLDGRRVAFWHEAFFDYCFARNLIGFGASLVSFLMDTEQHLFRRAQLRQVLEYLRDVDRSRYCGELKELLKDNRIRSHLKDLTISLAMSKEDPAQEEWRVFRPWIEAGFATDLASRARDQLVDLVGRHHFASKPWFAVTVESGIVADSLAADDDSRVHGALRYLHVHERHDGRAVARLLAPYVGVQGSWSDRLCNFMAHAGLAQSREVFDLFLVLTENGTLDPLIDRTNSTSPFWLRLHLLRESRPAWVTEALAAWLRRIFERVKGGAALDQWLGWHGDSASAAETIRTAAEQDPSTFMKELLPLTLQLAETNCVEGEPPRRDPLWTEIGSPDDIHTAQDALREGLARAVEKSVTTAPESADRIIALIARHTTLLANYLLLHAFRGGGTNTADTAIQELSRRPWHFRCGTPGNPYWTARALICQISRRCSAASRAVLEAAILSYVPHFEQTSRGARYRGSACLTLLSGIPPELRSRAAQLHYQELERKFGKLRAPAKSVEGGLVRSPIPTTATAYMTDEQWAGAMRRHQTSGRFDFSDPTRGGADELARELERVANEEPERFARIILRAPRDTNAAYVAAVLRGLRSNSAAADPDLMMAVCEKAYADHYEDLGSEIADVLGAAARKLPASGVRMLSLLATAHPDPAPTAPTRHTDQLTEVENWRGLETAGLNCVRGRAILAIGERVKRNPSEAMLLRDAIEHAVRDPSTAVRSQAALLPCLLAASDERRASKLFAALLDQPDGAEDSRLLATRYVRHFIEWDVRTNLRRQRPNIERALGSEDSNVSAAGAGWTAMAGLFHEGATDLLERAYRCNEQARQRIAEVANAGLQYSEHQPWCEGQLRRLFDDPSPGVRGVAGQCWRHLGTRSLEEYKDLISSFCESVSFPNEAEWLLERLDKSVHRLPELTCRVLERLMHRSTPETWDWQFAGHVDEALTTRLLLRTYHQHRSGPLATLCLDLLDQMCLSGLSGVNAALEGYER